MIQTTLFFILGFLCALFLAVLIAPAIWRRAVALTHRRIEASLPLTLDEIQADKDRLRAGLAVAARRLEMNVASLKDKTARQTIEIDRGREERARLERELEEKNSAITGLETQAEGLRGEVRGREDQLQALSERLAGLEAKLQERALELESLARLHDEASFNASSRQIEIVAQEARLEKLAGDIAILRNESREAEKGMRDALAEEKRTRDALHGEQKKLAAAERKIEGLTAGLSDCEEKLERRERELARLRARSGRNIAGRGEEAGDAALRETIVDLAAEVVGMAALIDGPDSPIGKALETPPSSDPAAERGNGEGATASLAERIRALRDAARTPAEG